MKKLIEVTRKDEMFLTLIAAICAYFIGHVLFELASMIWQDEAFGFLGLATAIPATLKLKDVKEIKPLPFEYSIVKTSTNKDAFKVVFKDASERNFFLGLSKMANILTFNYGYDQTHKTQIVGLLVTPSSERFIKDYNTMTANKALKIGEQSLEERKAAKEAAKAEKKANKGTAKAGNSSAIAVKIAAIEAMKAAGEITPLEAAQLIAGI